MPFVKLNQELYYFAHVPKCGGQSIEMYLREHFGELGFLDNLYYDRIPEERWSRTSPQHIPAEFVFRLVPESWVSGSFACVRNPYTRAISAYNFASLVNNSVEGGVGILQWFEANKPTETKNLFAYDNHLALQSALVPESAKIFKLEEGLDLVIEYINTLAGIKHTGAAIPHINQKPQERSNHLKKPVPNNFFAAIAECYEEDFKRFDYDIAPPADQFMYVPTINKHEPSKQHWLKRLFSATTK